MNYIQLKITKRIERITIDGRVIARGYAIDYHPLVKSVMMDGSYFIFTCDCGNPGCAGISAPIVVEHRHPLILWHLTSPGPERRLSFERAQYRSAIKEGLASIVQLLAPHGPDSYCGPYGSTKAGLYALYDEIRNEA